MYIIKKNYLLTYFSNPRLISTSDFSRNSSHRFLPTLVSFYYLVPYFLLTAFPSPPPLPTIRIPFSTLSLSLSRFPHTSTLRVSLFIPDQCSSLSLSRSLTPHLRLIIHTRQAEPLLQQHTKRHRQYGIPLYWSSFPAFTGFNPNFPPLYASVALLHAFPNSATIHPFARR